MRRGNHAVNDTAVAVNSSFNGTSFIEHGLTYQQTVVVFKSRLCSMTEQLVDVFQRMLGMLK